LICVIAFFIAIILRLDYIGFGVLQIIIFYLLLKGKTRYSPIVLIGAVAPWPVLRRFSFPSNHAATGKRKLHRSRLTGSVALLHPAFTDAIGLLEEG